MGNVKTTDGVVTKYVYGRGLIGEETNGNFKVYHFDYRGSTVAITDINGNVTDRFEYDTYGKLTTRTGTSDVIFLYNGRDGVVTDANGLIYMRARYYSPELRRFINADILAGDIANAVTLNRYAYANANPVSFVDPRGLSADGRGDNSSEYTTIREFVESRGGTATWNALFGIAKFELNGKSLYTDRFGMNIIGIDVCNDDGNMIAAEYDLAYYFEVDDWATYFPDFEWYDGSEGQEGIEGFGVRTTKHFLSKDFCLDYADNIIEMAGTDGEYLGQDRLGIAQECYAHAVIYLWTEISTTLIDRGHRYNASAEEIGYIENDPNRPRYSAIWNLGVLINPKANSSPFNI